MSSSLMITRRKKLCAQFSKYNRKIYKSSPRLHLTKKTIGIATEIQCQCSVCGSQPIFETNASRMTLGRSDRYITNESYELNCMFLLALQLLGGGGADVEVLLGFLNVPHGSTLHCLETKLSPIICSITENEINKALQEEVFLQLQKENRVSDNKKLSLKENIERPKLTVLYDMGG